MNLKRKIGLFPVTNIVIANMVGTGIFVTSGLLLADLNNPLVMIFLWLVGGLMAFFGALCYGELGAAYPEAGASEGQRVSLWHELRPRLRREVKSRCNDLRAGDRG